MLRVTVCVNGKRYTLNLQDYKKYKEQIDAGTFVLDTPIVTRSTSSKGKIESKDEKTVDRK